MQEELVALGHTDIHILAVNAAGLQSGNPAASAGRDLPLLQDTSAVNAWGLWGAVWRDVIVLDRANAPVATFNLTSHNLADPAEYAALRQILLDTAALP